MDHPINEMGPCGSARRPSFRESASADNGAYTVPLWCTLYLLDGAVRRGFALDDLLRRMGAPADAQAAARWAVPIENFASVLRYLARRMGDELLGLWERPVPLGTFSSVVQQLLSCATLGDALALGIRLYRLVAPGFPLRLRTSRGLSQLELRQPGAKADVAFEAVAIFWVLSLARWLVDRPIPLRDAWMSSSHQDPRYSEQRPFFEIQAQYGRGATGVAFDAGWLQRPLARAPGSLNAFLAAVPANLIRGQRSAPCTTEQVRSQLLLHGGADQSLPTLQVVARTLSVSPRSLRRRLQLEGRSYLDLKDEIRRDLALNWVVNSDVALVEVGHRLGFSDASTFHRAFKRWTGAAPGEFRRRQHPLTHV